MVMQPGNGVEQSTYVRITCEAEFKEQINADGECEVSFDQVATLALTPDAAEKFYWMPGVRIPELRRLADSR
jgi:hypothetical protein